MNRLARLSSLGKFLFKQRFQGFDVDDEPMLDLEANAWFVARLEEAQSYLEFGAGGTTRLAARLGIPTISVESDTYFARAVREGFAQGHKVQLVDAGIGLTTQWGIPVPGTPSPHRVRRWRNYIDRPFDLLAQSQLQFPDLILVDGRFRRACAVRCALEANRSENTVDLLFDDYFGDGRSHYHRVEDQLGVPDRIGRAALFRIEPTIDVDPTAIDEAIQDFR